MDRTRMPVELMQLLTEPLRADLPLEIFESLCFGQIAIMTPLVIARKPVISAALNVECC